jgi:hypothetical protein
VAFVRFAMRRAGGDNSVLRRNTVRFDLLRSGMSSLVRHCSLTAP